MISFFYSLRLWLVGVLVSQKNFNRIYNFARTTVKTAETREFLTRPRVLRYPGYFFSCAMFFFAFNATAVTLRDLSIGGGAVFKKSSVGFIEDCGTYP